MNPHKKPTPTRGAPQPFTRQAGAARQFKPVVAQLKTSVSAQSIKRPVAPSVYRPQQAPRVLQTKSSSGQNPRAGQLPPQVVAPPVYRPQQSPKAAQPKMINGALTRKPPITPPVYRPQHLSRVMQTKMPRQPAPELKQAPSIVIAEPRKPVAASPGSHAHPRFGVLQAAKSPAKRISNVDSRNQSRGMGVSGVPRASAAASIRSQHNVSRNSIQRYLEDVEPDTYWDTITSTSDRTAGLRRTATDRRWEKTGIEGGAREPVDTSNTVMSSAVVEYFVRGERRTERTRVHVSGNPWTSFSDKAKMYRDREVKQYCVDERDCAEPKVLIDVNAVLREVRNEGGIRTLVYLYSEFTPCRICEVKIRDWLALHKNVELLIVADRYFEFGPFRSTWEYDGCEGRLYRGWQAQPRYKQKPYVRPAVSNREVTESFSFAAAAGGGGGGSAAAAAAVVGGKKK